MLTKLKLLWGRLLMKFNKKVLDSIIFILIWGGITLSDQFSWTIYVVYIFIDICLLSLLVTGVISIKKSNKFKERKLVIRIPYYGELIFLVLILSGIVTFNRAATIKSMLDIFIIVVSAVNIPIDYKNNSKINIYESGIYLAKNNLFVKKIIPYNEINKLYFGEYNKGKFIFEIRFPEESDTYKTYKYKIREKDKQKIILFINDFVDKEKIIESKEY